MDKNSFVSGGRKYTLVMLNFPSIFRAFATRVGLIQAAFSSGFSTLYLYMCWKPFFFLDSARDVNSGRAGTTKDKKISSIIFLTLLKLHTHFCFVPFWRGWD